MQTIKAFAALAAPLVMTIAASAAVHPEGLRTERAGTETAPLLSVYFDLPLARLDLGSNRQAVFTPVVTDGTQQAPMQQIIVNGPRQQIKYERRGSSPAEIAGLPAPVVVRYDRKHPQTVTYHASIPLEKWMETAEIKLHEDRCGCGNVLAQDALPVGPVGIKSEIPQFEYAYVTPAVETLKKRDYSGSAFVTFKVNKWDILPDYRDNSAELRKITETIDVVRRDKYAEVKLIEIHGYASPEGSYAGNAKLASERASALSAYVAGLYDFPRSVYRVASTPEDWAGLRRALEAGPWPQKDALLAVIDSSLEPDAKDAALRRDFPREYTELLENVYPTLRRSDYKVEYHVRDFSLDEIREVVLTNPRDLSVEEIYRLACTYPKTSDEYAHLIETAVRSFPANEDANLNAAVLCLDRGLYDRAAAYAAKAGDSAAALDVLGSALWLSGDREAGVRALRQAAGKGSVEAIANLRKLNLSDK